MSVPTKGSRPIEVDGVRYRWLVRRRPTAEQRSGRTPLLLAVAREDGGGASLVVRLCHLHPSNEVRRYGEAVTPRVVAAWIRAGLRHGWQPERPGPQVLLSGRDHTVQPSGPRAAPRGLREPTRSELEQLARERAPSQRDRFRLAERWPEGPEHPRSPIEINGTELVAMVREIERPFVQQELAERAAAGMDPEDLRDYAGEYFGFSVASMRMPSRVLLDEPDDTAGKGFVLDDDDPRRGKATLLGCTCGIVECWFLLVRITVLDDVVIWSGFEQFHRNWIYGLGPFVFDKRAYLRELGA